MDKCRILSMLKNYSVSDALRLHMPGHKGKTVRGADFLNAIFPFDVTELSFSDNLADPSGTIAAAQRDVAKIVGAEKSFFLTGGSSLGVMAAVYAAKDRGTKILIGRKSHKSVYNALALLGIEPVFLIEDKTAPYGFTNGNLLESNDNELIGALLTSPDYYGNALDLAAAANALHKNCKLLIVDGAHGGHFRFLKPKLYAGNFADVWVDGLHKTMPALTQGALLNVNDASLERGVRKGLDVFSTSSPSYPIMASCEYAVKRFASLSEKTSSRREKAVAALSDKLNEAGFYAEPTDDPLKIVVCTNGASAENIERELEKSGIYCEMASENRLLAMIGLGFCEKDADRFFSALYSAHNKTPSGKSAARGTTNLTTRADFADVRTKFSAFSHIPARALKYADAVRKTAESVPLSKACGRICAENAGLFPPCFPLIAAGEKFDAQIIGALKAANAFGVENGFVKVVVE